MCRVSTCCVSRAVCCAASGVASLGSFGANMAKNLSLTAGTIALGTLAFDAGMFKGMWGNPLNQVCYKPLPTFYNLLISGKGLYQGDRDCSGVASFNPEKFLDNLQFIVPAVIATTMLAYGVFGKIESCFNRCHSKLNSARSTAVREQVSASDSSVGGSESDDDAPVRPIECYPERKQDPALPTPQSSSVSSDAPESSPLTAYLHEPTSEPLASPVASQPVAGPNGGREDEESDQGSASLSSDSISVRRVSTYPPIHQATAGMDASANAIPGNEVKQARRNSLQGIPTLFTPAN